MSRKPPNTAPAHEPDVSRSFAVVVTKDEDGWFVGEVPALPGCLTQGRTVAEVTERIKEAILLFLDAKEGEGPALTFVGVEQVTVEA